MITLVFDETTKTPLYQQLYLSIRNSIQNGEIVANEKLPSKRKLAVHLNISQCTVENAYRQLIAEGYLSSIEKRGYYANSLDPIAGMVVGVGSGTKSLFSPKAKSGKQQPEQVCFDLKTNTLDTVHFPYSVWSRLMRECMRNEPENLISPIHPQGDEGLRRQIVRHLHDYRGMDVHPEQIVIGAGTEYLLGLITELLPKQSFAIEDPGHHKFSKLLSSRDIPYHPISVDGEGLLAEQIEPTKAQVALITPSHQFPLGVIMSISRRQQLLHWAAFGQQRYLIEDDFNSAFSYGLRPVPALYSLDANDKVIYLNSFANTLAPSLRIAYMVLPIDLLRRYHDSLSFYSCTVSKFEQLTLKLFLEGGYFERHLNRMRKVYKKRQAALIDGLAALKNTITLDGQKAGLHLLVWSKTLDETQLVSRALQQGVRVYPLSAYYYSKDRQTNAVVLGFAGYTASQLSETCNRLIKAWR